jgi:hypothetical protein
MIFFLRTVNFCQITKNDDLPFMTTFLIFFFAGLEETNGTSAGSGAAAKSWAAQQPHY